MSRPKPAWRSTPVTDWPEPDHAAWIGAQEPQDPLEPQVGFARRWKVSTRSMIEYGYGRWLGWLVSVGELDPKVEPQARATTERVGRYIEALRGADLADYTVALALQHLGNALLAMDPTGDVSRILRASSRTHAAARPVRDVAARLQPVEDVVQLGVDLMHAADHDRFRTPGERAVLFRDGLLLAVLAYRPLRLGNLASITIGSHLQRRGAEWWLTFDKREVKGGEPLEYIWPCDLVAALERYLEVHLKALLAAPTSPGDLDALWVGKGGRPMGYDAISYQIKSRTKEEFGKAINPHAFRHTAATTMATADPENVAFAANILGHSSPKTYEQHYNKANMASAAVGYHEVLRGMRGGKRKGTGRVSKLPVLDQL